MAQVKQEDFRNEPYENLRGTFTDEANKKLNDAVFMNHYFNVKIGPSLEKYPTQFKILDQREALAIAFYLEDLESEGSPAIDYATWLDENFRRNPGFFSRSFEIQSDMEIPMSSEKAFTASLAQESRPDNVTPFTQYPAFVGEIPPGPTIDVEFTPSTESQNKLSELLDNKLVSAVDETRKLRKQELEADIKRALAQVLRINMVEKVDILASIAENTILRSALATMLNSLQVEVQTTRINDKLVASSAKISFDKNDYTVEDIKKGVIQSRVKIQELIAQGEKFKSLDANIRELENKLKAANRELSNELTKARELEVKLEQEKAKPKIEQAKIISYHIAYSEEGKRYYLGSSADEANETTGLYPVKSIYKTTKRSESVPFKEKQTALNQIARIEKFYAKINREEKISLEHIKKSFLVTILDYEDRLSNKPVIRQV